MNEVLVMKEDMLEVLIYLFENYIVEGISLQSGESELTQELTSAGFDSKEISKAFVWLEELLDICDQDLVQRIQHQTSHSMRVYTPDELTRLQMAGLSLLTRLVNVGVLDQFSREMVVDRVMALDSVDVTIDHIKWVVLMVISNQPDYDDIAEWAEVVVGGDFTPVIH